MLMIFVLLLPVTLYSQTVGGKRGPYQVDADYGRFYGDSDRVYVEIYYGLRENMLSYHTDGDKLSAAAHMEAIVKSDTGTVAHKEWLVPYTVDDTSKLSTSQTLMGIQSMGLVPGNYALTVRSYDMGDLSRRDSLTMPLMVMKFAEHHEALSDIELCTSIQSSSNKQSIFYKNTLEVIPNAGRLYGIGLPVLYYYFEAYNLSRPGVLPDSVTVRTTVTSSTGQEMISKERRKTRMHDASVEIGTLNLSALHSGTYLLEATLMDTGEISLAVSTKKFFVYKPGGTPDTSVSAVTDEAAVSEYAIMSTAQLNEAFAEARYIATQDERNQFSRMTDDKGRRNFLFDFWKRRDTDPSTPVNEFKREYEKRIEYANKEFSIGQRQGWNTDRGRVYLVYGPYDDIERNASTSESAPYEIWHYNNIQGGVIFVFVDRNGFGDYQLVHSTDRDELSDENWYEDYAHRAQ